MDVRQSIFGEVAIRTGTQVSGVDIETLLRRLLLFDGVVIKSVRLREIPYLVRAFGSSGFLTLLNSELLKMSCEFTFLIGNVKTNGVRQMPLFHYDFGIADMLQREEIFRKELRSLQGISGLKNPQRVSVEETILDKLVRPPANYGQEFLAQTKSDLRNNSPALMFALKEQLKMRNIKLPQELNARVEQTQDGMFRLINNLSNCTAITPDEAHDILWLSILAVGNINQRVADMAAYSSITGFAESEAPILFGKFAGILAPQNPELIEEQFVRVLSIANFPEFDRSKKVDVEALLKARDSAELREFRSWLLNLGAVGDKQIAEMIEQLRSKLGSIFHSSVGKTVRFVASTALGLIPHAGIVIGPAASAIDSFLIDRVFPTSGVVAFLTKIYPSLFESA